MLQRVKATTIVRVGPPKTIEFSRQFSVKCVVIIITCRVHISRPMCAAVEENYVGGGHNIVRT